MSVSNLIPNSLQYPNFYVDELMCLLTPEENVVLMFAARQILGWDDSRGTRKARIALSVFVDGFKSETGFENHGTGLSSPTVKKCLNLLCDVGVLVKHATTNDGTEYAISFSRDSVNIYALSKRKQERDEREKKRHAPAVKAMLDKRGVQPDSTPGLLSDTTPGVLPDSTIKQRNPLENKSTGDSKTESPQPEPVVTFDDLHSQSDAPAQITSDAAIQVFQEVRGKFPPKETYAMIIEQVGSEEVALDYWRKVLIEYAALGWNRQSVTGPLEWFARHELPHVERKNGGGKGAPTWIDNLKAGFAMYDEATNGGT